MVFSRFSLPCTFIHNSPAQKKVVLTVFYLLISFFPCRNCCSCRTSTPSWRWLEASVTAPSPGLKTHRTTSVMIPTRCYTHHHHAHQYHNHLFFPITRVMGHHRGSLIQIFSLARSLCWTVFLMQPLPNYQGLEPALGVHSVTLVAVFGSLAGKLDLRL